MWYYDDINTAYRLRIDMRWDLIAQPVPHRMNITVTYSLFIHEIISQNMFLAATHLLLIDGNSLVLNMQY